MAKLELTGDERRTLLRLVRKMRVAEARNRALHPKRQSNALYCVTRLRARGAMASVARSRAAARRGLRLELLREPDQRLGCRVSQDVLREPPTLSGLLRVRRLFGYLSKLSDALAPLISLRHLRHHQLAVAGQNNSPASALHAWARVPIRLDARSDSRLQLFRPGEQSRVATYPLQ